MVAWSGPFVFGVTLLLFGWLAIRPQRLFLDQRASSCRADRCGGRPGSSAGATYWFVYPLPHGEGMIGYDHVNGARPDTVLGRMNHHIGVDAALPEPWSDRPEQPVAEPDACRERALATIALSA